jgi:hypothetical protein
MNATPPEAKSEYSRAGRGSGPLFRGGGDGVTGREIAASGPLRVGLLAGGSLGALLLAVAEFTALFRIHVAASGTHVKSVGTGSHHSYAMLLIAVCAAALAWGIWRVGSRPALLGLGVLGVAALLIALLGDLPDASATGLVMSGGHYVNASSTLSAGFYLETLGAVMLLFTSVWGFLLIGAPPGGRRVSGSAGAA